MKSKTLYLATAIAMGAMSLSVHAADEAKAAPSSALAMRVYVDPETGTLVDHPVTDEQRAVAEQVTAELQANPNPGWKVYASGAIGADLEGRFEMSSVATVDADGKLSFHCDDEDHVGHDHDAAQQPARDVK
jgi:hypothetical protein